MIRIQRYGCFKIRTTCSSCGQPLPINGPYKQLTCTSCFKETTISPDIIADFLNDFEEEFEGFTEGQGSGGTLMSGSGTFKYSYWRLEPYCSSCKSPLSIPEVSDHTMIKCVKCNTEYHVSPAPHWLRNKVPSLRFCLTSQPPPEINDDKNIKFNEHSTKPVVMSCPQCAGALSVSQQSERIMECQYCNSEIYVPDAVWKRLHPVRITEEWFVLFEGKNIKQLQAERRIRDIEEEKKELKKWRLKNVPKRTLNKFIFIFAVFGIFLLLITSISFILFFLGYNQQDVSEIISKFVPFILIPVAILIPVVYVFRTMFSSQIGKGKECKKAIAQLAKKHNWKHEAAEYRSSLGYINAKYHGRDIEIDPGDDYAIEVKIHNSPFYIKTEPPGYPHEAVQRFTTWDSRFDSLFPIRYANPEIAEKIEKSIDEAQLVLSPIYWFLDRWEKKLGRLKIDFSDVEVHLKPGHVEMMDSGNRYLLTEDLEPLLEDMIILSKGIDAIASGSKPELP